MEKTLKDELKEQLLECNWLLLEKHNERGALFVIAPELDLVDVAVAIAEDQVEVVEPWISSQKLRRPTEAEIKTWEAEKKKDIGQFLIVQPYVILKLSLSK